MAVRAQTPLHMLCRVPSDLPPTHPSSLLCPPAPLHCTPAQDSGTSPAVSTSSCLHTLFPWPEIRPPVEQLPLSPLLCWVITTYPTQPPQGKLLQPPKAGIGAPVSPQSRWVYFNPITHYLGPKWPICLCLLPLNKLQITQVEWILLIIHPQSLSPAWYAVSDRWITMKCSMILLS